MSTLPIIYDVEEDKSAEDLKFLFVSIGQRDVVKAIQYSYVQDLYGRKVYNLGFGDYDLETDTITDNVNTNNSDAYKVLNTVLSTVPEFFENYPGSYLMVLGSDGRPGFIESCKLNCVKNCGEECRNFNRRINIYRSYVNKNYTQLNTDYQFIGGILHEETDLHLEDYVRFKEYDSVILLKRNT